MLYKVLGKKDYSVFLTPLISKYELIGPKKIKDDIYDFLPIKDLNEIDINYKKTTLPPAKKLLFPSTEELLNYKFEETINITQVNQNSEKILFGINAWDLNGVNILDRIFTIDFIDENYMEKRNKLIIIGMDTEPGENNFACQMNSESVNSGFDLFLSDLGDRYFVRVATVKGNELLAKYASVTEASEKDFADYNKFTKEYRKKFKSKVDIENFHENFEITYGKNLLWDKLSKNCFSCGSCNLVCPTCFCFNVKDDMKINLKEGIKSREWDSCMICDYGLVTGGHNFRPTRSNRLKQRYRCKLKTFVDKLGIFSCVGCGRCIETCLAKINICEDINTIQKEVSV
ncbi:MAG: 4Fe-4S dicluster domain-containing protein [Candidatus Humimicrobiaceae bacterium]